MNWLQRLNNSFEIKGTQPTGTLTVNQLPPPAFFPEQRIIGNEITLYPHKNGENLIASGYNVNSVVRTCIDIIAKMFGKVPFYVVDIKRDEKKTWTEYKTIQWNLEDPRDRIERARMRKKSIDGIILDTELSKFLAKPNRNQSGTRFREQLIAYKKVTGEGNHWFNRGLDGDKQRTEGKPFEMFIIPKFVLQLVGNGVDPWEIVRYQMNFPGGQIVDTPKENILMWIEESLQMDNFLNHLRGQSPLESVLLQIQALNESAIREIKESVNGGAYGLLFRKDALQQPSPQQASFVREQINSAINAGDGNHDLAGTIAWLAGEWGYLPFGRTSQELQRLELTEKNKDEICNVLGVPPGILKTDQTYENAKSFWKQLIYRVIAPEAYSLRDAWNTTLPEMFGMNPELQQIDCDISALPELAQDTKELISAVKDFDAISKNEKRIFAGWEPINDPAYDVVPKDEDAIDTGNNLDEEEALLNQ